jgi:hypothetical protein
MAAPDAILRGVFVGHFALGFAAKRVAPSVSLWVAFVACQWLDLVWPVLVLAGVERVRVEPGVTAFTPLDFQSYPWSHSLLMALIWSALGFFLARRVHFGKRAAAVVALLVLSHWLLDWVSHRPDMPLWMGGPKLGLGLWQSVALTLVVELSLFAGGVWCYLRQTQPTDARGKWLPWSLVSFLLLVYLLNAFGPLPPADTPPAAIAGPALSLWLLVAWAGWADRHRETRGLGAVKARAHP